MKLPSLQQYSSGRWARVGKHTWVCWVVSGNAGSLLLRTIDRQSVATDITFRFWSTTGIPVSRYQFPSQQQAKKSDSPIGGASDFSMILMGRNLDSLLKHWNKIPCANSNIQRTPIRKRLAYIQYHWHKTRQNVKHQYHKKRASK